MEISLIAMPAKLLILGPGLNRFRLENEQTLVNLTVSTAGRAMPSEMLRSPVLVLVMLPIV